MTPDHTYTVEWKDSPLTIYCSENTGILVNILVPTSNSPYKDSYREPNDEPSRIQSPVEDGEDMKGSLGFIKIYVSFRKNFPIRGQGFYLCHSKDRKYIYSKNPRVQLFATTVLLRTNLDPAKGLGLYPNLHTQSLGLYGTLKFSDKPKPKTYSGWVNRHGHDKDLS